MIKFNKKNTTKGISLIEVLVGVSIGAIIIASASRIFSFSLLGNKKSDSIMEIKQTGNGALSIIENKIRNAIEVDCTTPNQITITNSDFGQTTYLCQADQIASVGASQTYLITSSNVNVENFQVNCQPATDPNLVQITFIVGKTGPNIFTDSIDFETSIKLRN